MPKPLLPLLIALPFALGLAPAQAEKADRFKPLVMLADNGGEMDKLSQRTEFVGNAVLTKGSLLLRAEKIAVRETADGFHQAYASGTSTKPVSFRQARDVPGESIEGVADQLEFDTRSDTVRFIGNATVRRLRGALVADEVSGAVISYDNRSEVFKLEGGSASPNPTGRARVVMMPRALPPEGAASAPELPLRPSTTLSPAAPKQPS